MGSVRYWNISEYGQWQIEQALEVLRWHAPGHHTHFFQVIEGVKYLGGDGCGSNAIACTAGPHGRWVVLTSPPENATLIDLAVTLSHEARHFAFDGYGGLTVVAHTCRNCSHPAERAHDAIYQEDERLRTHLAWTLAPQQLATASLVPVWQASAPTHQLPEQWPPLVPAAPPPDPLPLALLSLMRPTVPPEAILLGIVGLAIGLAAHSRRRW